MEELISNYGEVGALAILVSLMAWYLKYQTKRQAIREDKHDAERIEKENKRDEERKEETLFIRNLVVNDMKELHQDNVKTIVLINGVGENQDKLCKLIESVDKRINGRAK